MIKFNRVCGEVNCVTALPLIALLTVGLKGQTSFATSENSGVFDNIEAQIKSLVSTPGDGKIKGTYSTKHLLDSYSAGVQHVQGIAWLTDGRFALSHNSRSDRRGLFIVQSSDSDSVIVPIGGGGDHPGGMQAAGRVVAVPITGGKDEVVFMDCRQAKLPLELTHLRISNAERTTGAAGFAFDRKRGCHWVLTTNAAFAYGFGPSTLYKSNGKSLYDPECRFTKFGELANVFASQGGTQILFDSSGTMYIAALYRVEPSGEKNLTRTTQGMTATKEGTEMIALTKVSDPEKPENGGTLLLDKKLSDSGEWTDYGAGFRWGGTIVKSPDGKIWVAAVSRTLAYGPAEQFAKTKIWIQPPGG